MFPEFKPLFHFTGGLLSTGVKKSELLTKDGIKYNYCFPSQQDECDGPFAMERCADIRENYNCKRMKKGCKYRYRPKNEQCCLLYTCVKEDGGVPALEDVNQEVKMESNDGMIDCILIYD